MSINANSYPNLAPVSGGRWVLVWKNYVVKLPKQLAWVKENRVEKKLSRSTMLVGYIPASFDEIGIKTLGDLDMLESTKDRTKSYINEIIELRPQIKWLINDYKIQGKNIGAINIEEILPEHAECWKKVIWQKLLEGRGEFKGNRDMEDFFTNLSNFWRSEDWFNKVRDWWISDKDIPAFLLNSQKTYKKLNEWTELGVLWKPTATLLGEVTRKPRDERENNAKKPK